MLSVVFMVIGIVIRNAYVVHDQVTGAMILEEALERAQYNLKPEREAFWFSDQAQKLGNPRLWLGEYSVQIDIGDRKNKGVAAAGDWTLEMEQGTFRPEVFLQRTEALREIGDGWNEARSGV